MDQKPRERVKWGESKMDFMLKVYTLPYSLTRQSRYTKEGSHKFSNL